jgi:peptide chain release factor subunit 1
VNVTSAAIRSLVDRSDGSTPITSVYLNTDGARYPRAADYEARLDSLLRDVRKAAERHEGAAREGVLADADRIRRWVRDEFDRGDVKGLGLFASGGEIIEDVQVAMSVRNIAKVNTTPYVVPLEVILGRHYHIGLVIIERDWGHIFRYRLGRIEQYQDLTTAVHRQHSQGGWSQARFQRGIDEEVRQHMKESAETLFQLHEQDAFDALVIAGPHVQAVDFVKTLHPYLRDLVHGEPRSIDLNANRDEIRTLLQEVQGELVSARRGKLLQRLFAGQGAGEKAAFGLRTVVDAVNQKAVEVLFVVEGAGEPGFRSDSGALALREDDARAFGGTVERVDDLVDEIIEEAVRGGAHCEMFRDAVRLDGNPVAALLRF